MKISINEWPPVAEELYDRLTLMESKCKQHFFEGGKTCAGCAIGQPLCPHQDGRADIFRKAPLNLSRADKVDIVRRLLHLEQA